MRPARSHISDLSASKRRPALVAANIEGDDVVLCQITSELRKDSHAITLSHSDFREGGLKITGTIRPNRLFTADRALVRYKAGSLKESKMIEVSNALLLSQEE